MFSAPHALFAPHHKPYYKMILTRPLPHATPPRCVPRVSKPSNPPLTRCDVCVVQICVGFPYVRESTRQQGSRLRPSPDAVEAIGNGEFKYSCVGYGVYKQCMASASNTHPSTSSAHSDVPHCHGLEVRKLRGSDFPSTTVLLSNVPSLDNEKRRT